MIFRAFLSEKDHFFERLHGNVQRLFFSNIFQSFSDALVDIFSSAFIWRITGSIPDVLLFAIGSNIGLAAGFYLNGLFLRRIRIGTMYAAGCLAYAIVNGMIVLIEKGDPTLLFLYSLFRGVGLALYWGNRNYLEMQETISEQRQYFFGIIYAVGQLAAITIPFLAGWFIAFSQSSGWLSLSHAYWVLFGFSSLLMITAAVVVSGSEFASTIPKMIVRSATPLLIKRRLLKITQGLIDGITFIPPLLILLTIGNEGTLGTLMSIVSICAAGAMYFYGRFVHHRHQYRVLILSSAGFFLCTLSLAWFPIPINVLIYVLFSIVSTNFFIMSSAAIYLSLSEEEMKGEIQQRYSFIFDNELFLNVGRLLGVAFIAELVYFISPKTGLFYGPFLIGILQGIMMIIYFRKKSV